MLPDDLTDLPPLSPPAIGHNGGPPLQEPRRRGRPSISSPELREAILGQLAEGVSLRAICRAPGMPASSTLLAWRRDDPAFDRACHFAQRCGYEFLAGEVVAEAERVLERHGPKMARLVFNLRKQQLARRAPRFFGGE